MVRKKNCKAHARGAQRNQKCGGEYPDRESRSRPPRSRMRSTKQGRRRRRRGGSDNSSYSSDGAPPRKRRAVSARGRQRARSARGERTRNKRNPRSVRNTSPNLYRSFKSISSNLTHLKEDESEESFTTEVFDEVVPCGDSGSLSGITDLNGVKFLGRKDSSGPPLEITFKTGLVMHVTKAAEDVRAEGPVRTLPGDRVQELPSEYSVDCGGGGRLSSLRCCSASPIRVKSSKNFTDLDLRRKSFRSSTENAPPSFRRVVHSELKVILPPTSLRNSCTSLLNTTVRLRSGSGAQLSVGDRCLSSSPSPLAQDPELFSRLHKLRHARGAEPPHPHSRTSNTSSRAHMDGGGE